MAPRRRWPGLLASAELCAQCGHARVRHLADPLPGCAFVVVQPPLDGDPHNSRTLRCQCTGWTDKDG